MIRSKQYAGLTLIELLVVISIIGILTAVLIPAVQRARESARRAQCASNMKMIGLAIHQHVDSHGTFPGGEGPPSDASYLFQIMPYLEQAPLYSSINSDLGGMSLVSDENTTAMMTRVSTFQCPSEPARGRFPLSWAAPNYAANCGRDQRDGPFPNKRWPLLSPLSPSEITDGMGRTAGVSEWLVGTGDLTHGDRLGSIYAVDGNLGGDDTRAFGQLCDAIVPDVTRRISIGFKGGHWLDSAPGNSRYNHVLPPNNPSCYGYWLAVTAASQHDHGVNVLFLDGRVQFVKDSINPDVWYALGTRAGGEIVSADAVP